MEFDDYPAPAGKLSVHDKLGEIMARPQGKALVYRTLEQAEKHLHHLHVGRRRARGGGENAQRRTEQDRKISAGKRKADFFTHIVERSARREYNINDERGSARRSRKAGIWTR